MGLTSKPVNHSWSPFLPKACAVCCADIVVVSRESQPAKFSVTVGCPNHLTSPYFASLHQPELLATHFAAQIRGSDCCFARVRGKVSNYRGVVQIRVSDVVVEDDPNAEILHWLDCMRLAQKCYDLFPTPT